MRRLDNHHYSAGSDGFNDLFVPVSGAPVIPVRNPTANPACL